MSLILARVRVNELDDVSDQRRGITANPLHRFDHEAAGQVPQAPEKKNATHCESRSIPPKEEGGGDNLVGQGRVESTSTSLTQPQFKYSKLICAMQ